mgnify:CR=1 FL=1
MEGLVVLVVLLILIVPIGVAIWLISRTVQSGRSLEELARRVGARPGVLGAPTSSDILWICGSNDAIRHCARALTSDPRWKQAYAKLPKVEGI